MKRISILFLSMFLAACTSYTAFKDNSVSEDEEDKKVALVRDSVEYELVILDIDFENWFATRNLIASARSEDYYKHWNQQYVSEWNRLYMLGNPSFETYIDYDPFEDYGFEVNYKLYYYFQFVEEKTGIKLLTR